MVLVELRVVYNHGQLVLSHVQSVLWSVALIAAKL